MEPNWQNQTIWTGDNLDIMRGMNSESVDLIYLDPPFNSKANYAAPIGSEAAGAAFKDTWTLSDVDVEWINLMEAKHSALHRVLLAAVIPSDKSYLAYMAVRVLEMRRLLKSTGNIYLHCDPTMSHYLKLLMDAIFGKRNFRNEIVWCYKSGGRAKAHFPRKHQVILWYSKDPKDYFFNYDAVSLPRDTSTMHEPVLVDETGRKYQRNIKNGKEYRYYLDKGVLPEDWWADIQAENPASKKRTGYPTQKPVPLLARIINAGSNENDMIFDPFAGCATTCIAAEQLNRQWMGIDISSKAAELVEFRMKDELGLFYQGVHRKDIPKRTDLGKLPRYNSPVNRTWLYGEQEGNCAGCDHHFEARNLEVDHIISKRKGGTNHLENLQLLCGSCNRIKGDRGMEYLKVKLQIR